ncbi:MAG: nucleotidyltransferase family protein, partial [Acidobacteriota bacterium]|nr:nucleotidyltransferase family protein [Acidobacteriota bacterium]
RRTVRHALAAGLDPVIVILGHELEKTRAELEDLTCRTVLNPDHEKGIHGSVELGFAEIPPTAAAGIELLADMPFVTDRVITEIVRRYRDSNAPLVISTYGEILAPPFLYDRSLFAELRNLDSRQCTKQVARRHLDEAVVVSWPPSMLADLDAPEDYARIRSELAVGYD